MPRPLHCLWSSVLGLRKQTAAVCQAESGKRLAVHTLPAVRATRTKPLLMVGMTTRMSSKTRRPAIGRCRAPTARCPTRHSHWFLFAQSPAEAKVGTMSYCAARVAAAGEYGASHSACDEADAMRRTGPSYLLDRLLVRRRQLATAGKKTPLHSARPYAFRPFDIPTTLNWRNWDTLVSDGLTRVFLSRT